MTDTRSDNRSLDALAATIIAGSPAVAMERRPRRPRLSHRVTVDKIRILDIHHVPLAQPHSRRVSLLISQQDGTGLALALVGGAIGLRSFGPSSVDGFDEQVIELTESGVFGRGQRKWFACPGLTSAGCSSRRMKLYLPPGQRVFACSDCHNLVVPHNPDRPVRWQERPMRQVLLRWQEPLEMGTSRIA